jgi:hypothetical protein
MKVHGKGEDAEKLMRDELKELDLGFCELDDHCSLYRLVFDYFFPD